MLLYAANGLGEGLKINGSFLMIGLPHATIHMFGQLKRHLFCFLLLIGGLGPIPIPFVAAIEFWGGPVGSVGLPSRAKLQYDRMAEGMVDEDGRGSYGLPLGDPSGVPISNTIIGAAEKNKTSPQKTSYRKFWVRITS